MARVIVVAEREAGPPDDLGGDRRAFQLKERVTSSDARDPHVAAQLIERIGWALADAEDVEMRQSAAEISLARRGNGKNCAASNPVSEPRRWPVPSLNRYLPPIMWSQVMAVRDS